MRCIYTFDGCVLLIVTTLSRLYTCFCDSDPVTGKIYHMTYNPPPDDIELRARLQQRDDDTEEKALVRIQTYTNNLERSVV
jgi:hypothetical protein